VRQQEMVQKGVWCFRYRKEGHKKWECLRMKKEMRMEEKVALLHNVWRKVREHYKAKGFPPKGTRISMEGWTM